MGRRKSCSLLPSLRRSPLFLARVVSSCLFFSLHSLLFISFASLLSLLVHMYISRLRMPVNTERERGKFRRLALYLRRASTSNGFDVLGRNAYLSRAHTRAWGDSSCVRARARVYTRARPDPATRDIARREDEEGFTAYTHTHARAARA